MTFTKKDKQIIKGSSKYRTKKNNLKQKTNKYYYLVKSIYINNQIINKAFNIRNNWEKYNVNNPQKRSPDFLYLDGNYLSYKDYWKFKPLLQNKFDSISSNLTSKDILYKTLEDNKSKFPVLNKYMINNINIDFKDYITSNNKINYSKLDDFRKYFQISDNNKNFKRWIFKPVGGYQGIGIVVFSNFQKFKNKCTEIINFIINNDNKSNIKKKIGHNYQSLKLYNRWVLQEYIDKTLLYPNITSGKKIHLRVYFLYFKDTNNKVNGYILDTCHLGMAKKIYKSNDYTNKDIHDTHLGKNKKGLTFPYDFKNIMSSGQIKNIFQQLKELFGVIKVLFKASCYPGIKNCYEILGGDIIILPDYSIKLIELNSSLNIINNPLEKANTHQKLFNGLMELVVDKVFPPMKSDYKFINSIPNHFITV